MTALPSTGPSSHLATFDESLYRRAVTTRAVLWFRRDLRLADHPALLAAADTADEVVGVFVLDPRLWRPAGAARRQHLIASLRSLDASMQGQLVWLSGDPRTRIPQLVRDVAASSVHISADFGPYGAARDVAVEQALGELDVPLVRTGSPYAVAPGRVVKEDGTPYRVYSPFYRAWVAHGWRAPAADPERLRWASGVPDDPLPELDRLGTCPSGDLPEAGEAAAHARWEEFRDDALSRYADDRNRPDIDGSSRLSVHLKYGEIHPRTLLAELRPHGLRQRPRCRGTPARLAAGAHRLPDRRRRDAPAAA